MILYILGDISYENFDMKNVTGTIIPGIALPKCQNKFNIKDETKVQKFIYANDIDEIKHDFEMCKY